MPSVGAHIIGSMTASPEPDWYFEHVLNRALPGRSGLLARSPAEAWRDWWQARAMSDDPVVAAAAHQGFVLRTVQLATVGVSRTTARTRVRRGSWISPRPGTVAPIDVRLGTDDRFEILRRTHALQAAASAICRPGHVISARSAAVLRGLPTLAVPTDAELTAPDGCGLEP